MKQYDLTNGRILDRLLLVAMPIMGTMLMQMAYNMTDMFWLGRLSADAVAASGTAGMYMWLSMAFMMFGRTGAEIGVSQSLGRNDPKTAKAYAQNAVLIGFAFGAAWMLVSVAASRQLISVFNIREQNVANDAAVYLQIVSVGCPFLFAASSFAGMFNGSGNSRLSFIANSVGLVVNMVMDPILIFTFEMGIVGAAVATAVGQITVSLIFIYAAKKSSGRPFETFAFRFKPSGVMMTQIMKWSLPVAAESFFFTVLSMVITRAVSDFGAGAIAVSKVGSQVESLSWLIGGGFGSALTAFVGQNFGAGKWSRIHQGFRMSVVVMLIWGLFITLLMFFGGRWIFALFIQEDAIRDMGRVYLQIFAFCQLAGCLEAVAAGAFRGIGRTMPPSVISILFNTLRVPLSFILCRTPLGLNGIWVGATIGAVGRGFGMLAWYLLSKRKMPKEDSVMTLEWNTVGM